MTNINTENFMLNSIHIFVLNAIYIYVYIRFIDMDFLPLGTPRHRWEDNIKMNLQEVA